MIVPGLGLTHYLRRLVDELRRHGSVATVLDVLGAATRTRGTTTEIGAIASASARWVRERATEQAPGRRLVLVGHSTGAQAALQAALQIQRFRQDASVVLAGPTFAPEQRTLPSVMLRLPRAYRHDPPSELAPTELLRAGPRDLLSLVRSGQRDKPEVAVRDLRLPLTLTAGVHDALAPRQWLELLRANASASPRCRVVELGGSHNNPWTHPAQLAALILTAGDGPSPPEPLP